MRDLILLKFVRNQKYNRPNFDDSGLLLDSSINKRFEIFWNHFTQYRIDIVGHKYNEYCWMPNNDLLFFVELRNGITTICKRFSKAWNFDLFDPKIKIIHKRERTTLLHKYNYHGWSTHPQLMVLWDVYGSIYMDVIGSNESCISDTFYPNIDV